MTPEQAKALRESATNIIAHEKSLDREKEKLEAELDKVGRNARQAVMMADEAIRDGDHDRASTFNDSAEALSTHLVEIETRIAQIDIELIEARQASDEAKSMASDSAIQMAQTKAKGAELRADFERAKLAEASLDATGAPSYDEVKDKITDRVAQAEAMAELEDADGSVTAERATVLVEEAAKESMARAKLAEIRSSMGVAAPEFETADPDEEPSADVAADDGAAPSDEASADAIDNPDQGSDEDGDDAEE